jgi:serine/threonine protein kinase
MILVRGDESPIVVYELRLAQDEASPTDVEISVLKEAFVDLQVRGKTEDVVKKLDGLRRIPQIQRLIDTLNQLPRGAPYQKEELMWLADLGQTIDLAEERGEGTSTDVPDPVFTADSTSQHSSSHRADSDPQTPRRQHELRECDAEDYCNREQWTVIPSVSATECEIKIRTAVNTFGVLSSALEIPDLSNGHLSRIVSNSMAVNSPHLVRFMDVYAPASPQSNPVSASLAHPLLMAEYLPQGSLVEFMREFGCLSIRMWRTYSQDVLSGLQALHDHNQVHGRLRPAAVLLADDGSVQLCGYGWIGGTDHSSEKAFYMSPEVIKSCASGRSVPLSNAISESITPAADVWSFGVTSVELLTRRNIFKDLFPGVDEYLRWIHAKMDITVVENALAKCSLPRRIVDLLLPCFHTNPEARPSVKYLMLKISSLEIS